MWLKMDYPKCEIFRNKPQVLVSSKWHISLSILFVTIAGVDLLHCECSRPEIWVSDKYATVQLPFITTTFLFSLRLNLLSQQLAKAVTKSTSKTPASKMVFCALLNIFKNTDYLNQWSSTTTTLGALLYCFQNWRACMKQKRKLKTRNEVACSLLGHARFISECRLPKSILCGELRASKCCPELPSFQKFTEKRQVKIFISNRETCAQLVWLGGYSFSKAPCNLT